MHHFASKIFLIISVVGLLALGAWLSSPRSIPETHAASSCTHYASATGTGTGLSQSSPFKIADFWDVAGPGKTLCLLDGTYTGAGSMIDPPDSKSGVSGNPITIRALNDGQVLIDGQDTQMPIHLINVGWWVIEGVNVTKGQNETNISLYLDFGHFPRNQIAGKWQPA